MKAKYTKVMLAALVAASLGASYASAADTTQTYELEPVIVTAARMKQKLVDVAADTQVITEANIERGNYNTLSDALKANNIQVAQRSSGAFPILNGDSRVLVMVNGRKMNWDHLVVSGAQNAVNIDKISMDNVERIEVVKGPNSALYGERAVSGVINIITKLPQDGVHLRVASEYGSFKHKKGTFAISGGDEDTQGQLTFSREIQGAYKYRNPNGGAVKFDGSEIERNYLTGRVDHRVSGEDMLTFDFAYTRKNDGYGLRVNNIDTGKAYGSGNKQKSDDWSYGLTYTFNADTEGDGTYLRTYRNVEKSETVFGTAGSDYSHDLSNSVVEGQKVFKVNKNNTLTAGFMYSREHIRESNGGIKMNRTMNTKGVYAEDYQLLNNGWSINAGARYEHQSHFGGDVTAHIGVNKKFDDKTHAYVSFGTAVNNPSLKMLYANTQWWYGNKDLKQEKSHTVTVGVDSELSKSVTVSASAYQSWLTDALAWQKADGQNPLPTQGNYINVDKEKRAGFNLSATYKINPEWAVRASYAYTKSDKQSSKDKTYVRNVDNTYPQVYSLDLMYTAGKWSVDTMFNLVRGRALEQFNYGTYATLDMNVNYQATKDMKVYVKANNLLNRAYEVEAYNFFGRIVMPERNFVGGVEYKF